MVREMKHTEIGEIPAEWELQTFEETFRVLSNNTLPRADLNNRGGTVRNVHYGDILTQFGEVLNCEKDEVPYLNDVSLLTASAQILQDGDVILADTAEDDTVGKATEVYGLRKGRMVAGLHTIPCRVKKGDFAPKWLGYYMNSPIYHNQVLPYVTGIKVSSISKTAILETLIAVPPIEEQKVIVSALSEVDRLLAELKKTVSKLRDFKSGCLYLMFPQEGSDIPQMREIGYTEPWEQHKLGEVTESYSGGTPTVGVKEYYGGQIPFIRSAEINSDYTELFITEEGLNNSSARIVSEGDILYALYGATSGEVGRARFKGAINQAILAIKPYVNYDAEYIAQWLRKSKHNITETYLQGGQGNLSGSIVKELLIEFPLLQEQQKIGQFFFQLDHLIALYQQKSDKYAQIKKAMMSELITGKIKLV